MLGVNPLAESTPCTEYLHCGLRHNAWYTNAYTWTPPHTHAQMPHLAAARPVSAKPLQSCHLSAGTDKRMVNTGTRKIYDAVCKVKGLSPSLNCMLIYTLIFMPFFIVLKKNTVYWSVTYTHKSAQVMSVNHDELRKWTHLCDTPVSRHSLVAQWLRICAPNAGTLDLIPSQGTKFHTPLLKSLHATTNLVQPSKYIHNFKKENKRWGPAALGSPALTSS